MNLEKIATVGAQECIRQGVGIQQLSQLLTAYDFAFTLADHPDRIFPFDIQRIGELIEPDKGTIRQTPVTFMNGGSSANWWDVFRLLERLCENLPERGNEIEVDCWLTEFLWIHPFRDGNGRTGWVLYNLFMGTLDNPTNLPKYFGE